MTMFYLWVLKKITAKLVQSSANSSHEDNITLYYMIMYNAAQLEFNEDNKTTLDSFLTECFEESCKK